MDYLTWGAGPRSLLFLPGGPGSSVPTGIAARMSRRWFAPFVEAGYTVWHVTRRRGMPAGHSIDDMADDYARFILEKLGDRADLVLGVSFGGMVAQHLGAHHGRVCGRLAVVAAAAQVSAWGREVDARLAAALARGDERAVASTFAEYALPGRRSSRLRQLVGPRIGRSLMSGEHYPPSDLLVEIEAELSFDSRAVLPEIEVPVVLVCGDRDRFFPLALAEETARLIPDCALVRYAGQGHLKVSANRRVPQEVLASVGRG